MLLVPQVDQTRVRRISVVEKRPGDSPAQLAERPERFYERDHDDLADDEDHDAGDDR